ncbi:ammonium transporter [Haloferula rosea]|uniref:Ammonium transporter n=1 Tax=Haloferula rosea TaxID=490093 RepID=A0A934RCS9_9BACT|nr:ammonium transporter [Haloferula rosea]MBK1826080.1 ammonium transporter [Haloferula rosea]
MSAVRLIHRIVSALFAVMAVVLVLFFASKAFRSVPEVEGVNYGWGDVVESVPEATEPAEYADVDYTEAGEEMLGEFVADNGFVASTGVQMLVGLLGLGLMYTALARRESGRWALLHLLAMSGVVIFAFWLFGFNVAYPGDFMFGGLLPAGPVGPLMDDLAEDPFSYGMSFTIWTDFFYQSLYAVLAGALVLSLCAGRYRTPTIMLASIVVAAFGFPLTTSWLWGGGWLSSIDARDFAGSAMVHLLAGGAAFALVVLARVCPPAGPGFHPLPGSRRAITGVWKFSNMELALYLVGALLFLVLIVGVNAGSVLSNDAPVVAAVLNSTVCAVGGGALTAGLVSLVLAARPRVVILVIGALSGWAAVCAPADSIDAGQALLLGAVAGGLGASLLYAMDRLGMDDPFGVVAISFVGGGVGMISLGVFADDATVIAQLLAAGSISSMGVALGGSIGLIAWLARVLCEPPEMELPDVTVPSGQPSGEAGSI